MYWKKRLEMAGEIMSDKRNRKGPVMRHYLILVSAVVMSLQSAFARIGETPDECAARYGSPTKVKEFDPAVISKMEQQIGNSNHSLEASPEFLVPARVCEYKPQGWVITAIFGRFIYNSRSLQQAKQDAEDIDVSNTGGLPWEGERVIAMTFSKDDGAKIEREAIISVVGKQYEGPLGSGFPNINEAEGSGGDLSKAKQRLEKAKSEIEEANKRLLSASDDFERHSINNEIFEAKDRIGRLEQDLAYSQEIYNRDQATRPEHKEKEKVIAFIKKNYDAIIAGKKKIQPYESPVTFDEGSIRFAVIDGNGPYVDSCLERYKEVISKTQKTDTSADVKSKEDAILKRTEDALGTSGL